MAAIDEPRQLPKLPLKHRLVIACFNITSVLFKLFKIGFPRIPAGKTINGVTSEDFPIDSSRNIWLRLYTPPSTSSDDNRGNAELPFIVYYHGGGFVMGSPDMQPFDNLCRTIAREVPAIVASVEYRLAPQFRCPTAYDDGFDALKYFDGEEFKSTCLKGKKASLENCFVAGDSAGGNLAHHVLVRAASEGHKFQDIKVRGFIGFQPFLGGQERTESEIRFQKGPILTLEATDMCWKTFLPDGSDRDDPYANVVGPKAKDISGLDFPNTLLFVGGFDPLQDRQRVYAEWLRKSGQEVEVVQYPNGIHGFYIFPSLPETSMAVKEVRDFVQKHSSSIAGNECVWAKHSN